MDNACIRGNVDGSDRSYLVKVLTMAESITGMYMQSLWTQREQIPMQWLRSKSSFLRMGSSHPFLSEMENLPSSHCRRRLLRLQMSEQYGVPINSINTTYPAFTWMVKHCSFLHNRYQVGQDGKTPYERTWNQT
eukprot:6461537-Amphidinium_carterae.2